MVFPPLARSDVGNAILRYAGLQKLNHHSFFGNPLYIALAGLSGHCKRFLVLLVGL